MPDPSGEIVRQNPVLIPTPGPQWGRWGMTLIGALHGVTIHHLRETRTQKMNNKGY